MTKHYIVAVAIMQNGGQLPLTKGEYFYLRSALTYSAHFHELAVLRSIAYPESKLMLNDVFCVFRLKNFYK